MIVPQATTGQPFVRLSLLLTLACAAASGQGGTISGSFSGLVGGPPEPPGFPQAATIDTAGLFGPAGANLAGDSISVSYSYNTASFSAPGSSCGTACTYYATATTNNQPGNSVSVTVNGVTQSFGSTASQTEVTFQNSFPGYGANWFAESIVAANGATLSLTLYASNSLAFGQALTGITPNQGLTFLIGCNLAGCSGQENLVYISGETAPLQLTTTSVPNAVSGLPYSTNLAASGGVAPYSWEYFYFNSLPAGFTLSSAGVLSSTGSPAAPAGTYSFLAQVNDSALNATTRQLVLVVAPPPAPVPSILQGGIGPAGSGSALPVIQPGQWVSIYGTHLANSPLSWNGDFPMLLGGTSVTIDGKAAYLSYVSPTQINLQAPDDAATGPVAVVITSAAGIAASTVTLSPVAPSFLLLDSKHIAGIILRPDGLGAYGGGTYDIIGPTGNSLGYATVAAKAGDIVELFAVGLGPTNPTVPAGHAFLGAAATTNPVSILIGNVMVKPSFAGLSGAGLYQINLTVPTGLGAGDFSLVASVGGAQTSPTVAISLQ